MKITNTTTNPAVIALFKKAKEEGHVTSLTRYNEWRKDIHRFNEFKSHIHIIVSEEKKSLTFFIVARNGSYFSTWTAKNATIFEKKIVSLGLTKYISNGTDLLVEKVVKASKATTSPYSLNPLDDMDPDEDTDKYTITASF